VIRLLLAPFTSWNYDDSAWVKASSAGAYHLGLYRRPIISYPPVWGHLLQALGQLLPHLGLPASSFANVTPGTASLALLGEMSPYITSPAYNLAFKSVLFAFDTGTALVLYALVAHVSRNRRRARQAFIVFFLNPVVIFESGVMGDFDVIAAFAIILAIYWLVTRRYALCGAAMAFGALAKVVPALIVPLVLVSIVRTAWDADAPGATRRAVGDLARFVAGALATAFVLLLPEIVSGSLGGIISATFGRESLSVQAVGGEALIGLSRIRGLFALHTYLQNHPAVINRLNLLGTAAAVLWAMVRIARRGATPSILLSSTGAVLGMLLLTAPVGQPQYMIWLMPIVVALWVLYRAARFELWVLSIGTPIFAAFILGPIGFFGPVAAFTPALTVNQWMATILDWTQPRVQGILTTNASFQPSILVVAATVVAEVALVIRGIRRPESWAGSTKEPEAAPAVTFKRGSSPSERAIRSRERIPRFLLGATLAVSVVLAVTTQAGTPSGAVRVTSASVIGSDLNLRLGAQLGPAGESLRLVAFPVSSTVSSPRRVYVFYDARYPYVDGDAAASSELVDHLKAEFDLSRWDASVASANAQQLQRILSDVGHAPGSVVVDVTGVLPSTVFSSKLNLVSPWLDAGGSLIWGGAPIGQFVAGPSTKASNLVGLSSLGPQGSVDLVGRSPTGCTPRKAQSSHGRVAVAAVYCRLIVEDGSAPNQLGPGQSPMGAALEINYRSTSSPVAAISSRLAGGQLLGWYGDGASSVTALPVGKGSIVIFGGQVLQAADSSVDIATILISRAYAATGPPVWITVPASRIARAQGLVRWSIPLQNPRGPQRISLFAMDPNRLGTLKTSWVASVGQASPQVTVTRWQ